MMRKTVADRLYGTAKAMKDSVWAMLGSGEMGPAKMRSYISWPLRPPGQGRMGGYDPKHLPMGITYNLVPPE